VSIGAAHIVTTPKRNGMRVWALRMPERVRTTLISIGIGGGPVSPYVGEESAEVELRPRPC
jgi:hypothetical protein